MLDLNNSCATLMEHNTAQKIQHSKHDSQYIHSQHNTTDKEHHTTQNTCRLNALAEVQTQSMTYTAQCTSSSTNKMHDLEHITHEDIMHYLHIAHTAQQNK